MQAFLSQLKLSQVPTFIMAAKLPLSLLLLLFCLYNLGAAAYIQFLSPSFTASPLPVSRPATGQRWAWFQAPQIKKPKQVQEKVAETRMNAKLLGIIGAGSKGVAIIDTGKKAETKVFREGDKLSRTATLHKIEQDRVLINENGTVRSLTMETKRSGHISVEANTINIPNMPVLAGIAFIKTPNGDTGMSLGSISPRILAGTPLRSGDVVLQAAGNSVADIINNPNKYQNLLRRDNIDIVIMRGGTEQTLSINPRAMAPNVMRMMANQHR